MSFDRGFYSTNGKRFCFHGRHLRIFSLCLAVAVLIPISVKEIFSDNLLLVRIRGLILCRGFHVYALIDRIACNDDYSFIPMRNAINFDADSTSLDTIDTDRRRIDI